LGGEGGGAGADGAAFSFPSHASTTLLPPFSPPPAAVAAVVGPLARRHGTGVIAHTSIQPDAPEFSHFVLPGVGALAFGVARGGGRAIPLVLGDPLAPRSRWGTILDAFRDAYGAKLAVVEASEAFAAWAVDAYPSSFAADAFGAEPELDVSVWGVAPPTRKTRTLRRDARQARALVSVGEVRSLSAAARAEFAAVTLAWRYTKLAADRPLRVFCRTIDWGSFALGDGAGGRVFAAVAPGGTDGGAPPPPGTAVGVEPGQLQAYIVLDPLHEEGRVVREKEGSGGEGERREAMLWTVE
jgi:hypothetical protein